MNKVLSFSFLFALYGGVDGLSQTPCVGGFAGEYPCENVDFMSFLPLSEIGGGDNTNAVVGWLSTSGSEYAIVGCSNGTAFVNVTDPVNPYMVGFLPTHNTNSFWRDMETYGHYCFSVNEANFHGLQVFDLNQLDAVTNPPVTFSETAYYNGFGHCHTISLNKQTGFLYANGTSTFNGGLHIVDVSDPLNPVLAGGYELDGYTHDSFPLVYNGPDADYTGHEIVMAANEDALTIVDVTDKSDCQTVSINNYFNTGYTHQGWFAEDQRYFFVADELDELNLGLTMRTHIFDCQDLDNVEYMGFYDFGFDNIDHNIYVKDQYLFEADYASGVRILDGTNVATGGITEVGYFDVHPENNGTQFLGTWSVYPYFPSGNIMVTDMYDGVFVLKFNAPVGIAEENAWSAPMKIQPNPASEGIVITSSFPLGNVIISDITGKTVFNQENISLTRMPLDVSFLNPGVYLVSSEGHPGSTRLVIE